MDVVAKCRILNSKRKHPINYLFLLLLMIHFSNHNNKRENVQAKHPA